MFASAASTSQLSDEHWFAAQLPALSAYTTLRVKVTNRDTLEDTTTFSYSDMLFPFRVFISHTTAGNANLGECGRIEVNSENDEQVNLNQKRYSIDCTGFHSTCSNGQTVCYVNVQIQNHANSPYRTYNHGNPLRLLSFNELEVFGI